MDYEPVIGLEVHLQLSTVTKLFCGCSTTFGAPPNSQTCPVCLGLPGVLPVLNEQAVAWGVRVACALDATIGQVMKFDRKQYFYPDLPKGYQISQYDQPLAQHGHLDIIVDGQPKRVGIRRIHLEEDAGKLLHDASATESFVDFNRTGVPLLEIVTEPDLRSADEAYQYLTELKAILEYLDVSTCNMEEGSLRCDTNISLRPPEATTFGSRVEVKNLNSFRAVKLALEYEATRQAAALDGGESLPQETRLWNAKAQRTEPLRSKEDAADYRYFPEPDLVPFVLEAALVARTRQTLPELPAQRRSRLQAAYQLCAYDAHVLTQHRALSDLFEGALRCGASPKPVAHWIMGDLLAYLNARGLEPAAVNPALLRNGGVKLHPAISQKGGVNIRPEWLAHLVELMVQGTLSGRMAKEVFLQMVDRGLDPVQIVTEGRLTQIVDPEALERIAEEVVQANPKSVADYRSGKVNAFTYLMGQAMKRSQGKANPQHMTELLKRKLSNGGSTP